MIKDAIRNEWKEAVEKLSASYVAQASQLVCTQLQSLASVANADTIFAYCPLADEIDLRPLLQTWIDESRVVCVPLISWDDHTMRAGMLMGIGEGYTQQGKYQIHEPTEKILVPHDTIDVVVVPGVAFDEGGRRLGHGGGFYDRFLAQTKPPVTIGVAFDEQLHDELPNESHDMPVTALVTPSRIIV